MISKPIQALCNEGCEKAFNIYRFDTRNIEDDIERTFFICPHCKHEYTAYYTDSGVRKLQEKMRDIHMQMAEPNADSKKLFHQEELIRKRIKNVMGYLKNRYETKSAQS